ncbi:MAG TPA: hypothetical protein VGN88_11115 [Phycisphaerae bacterium]
MTTPDELFPESAEINPAAAEGARADYSAIPAKGAVYLLTGPGEKGGQESMLLATVGDLRAALKRRLADTPPEVKSKRIAYGNICTRVHYRIVYSPFAANFYYAQAARALFAETAEALIPWRSSWWIGVERGGAGTTLFPRFRKTNNLSDPTLQYAGPVRDKHAAQRLVESLEDLFDLCRYQSILVQAPQGKACAYKEMGKCPAACDGSESLAEYRARIDEAFAFAAGNGRDIWQKKIEGQMKAAAVKLQFEAAGRLKQRLKRAGAMLPGGLSQRADIDPTACLEDFAFLTLQPGKGKPWIEPWLVHPADAVRLEQVQFKEITTAAEGLAKQCEALALTKVRRGLSPLETRMAGLMAHHLLRGEDDPGIWLRVRDVASKGTAVILAAAESLKQRKAAKPMTEQSTDAMTEVVIDKEDIV